MRASKVILILISVAIFMDIGRLYELWQYNKPVKVLRDVVKQSSTNSRTVDGIDLSGNSDEPIYTIIQIVILVIALWQVWLVRRRAD